MVGPEYPAQKQYYDFGKPATLFVRLDVGEAVLGSVRG